MMEDLEVLGFPGELVPGTPTLNCFELQSALVKDGGGESPAFRGHQAWASGVWRGHPARNSEPYYGSG